MVHIARRSLRLRNMEVSSGVEVGVACRDLVLVESTGRAATELLSRIPKLSRGRAAAASWLTSLQCYLKRT